MSVSKNPSASGPASISVVVPVYRSSKTLLILYERTSVVLNALTDDWEMIMVDDCSPDDAWSVLENLHAHDPRVRIVRFGHNHGQQHATLCGLGYASKDYVLTIDDDLQCYPEDIPLFIDALRSGKQVVIGRITGEKQHSWWRNLGSRLNRRLMRAILGIPSGLAVSTFRGMTGKVVKSIVAYKGAHPHMMALLLKSVPTAYLSNVDIHHAPRHDGGASSYSLRKLIRTFSLTLINQSYFPLRFMVGWGVLISVLSMGFAIWVAAHALVSNDSIPGWASLAVLVAFLSGNILLALGIVGEYIGRLVEENSKAAQFSVFDEQV